jgi:uncharacterized membrane protein (UPF0182 family)
MAIFIFYVLGIGFAGCAILGSIGAFVMPFKRLVTMSNFVITALSSLCFLIGSVITTIGAKEGAETISDFGEDVGVSASAGEKFIVISWVSFAVMAVATVYWMADFCLERRSRKRVYTEKR